MNNETDPDQWVEDEREGAGAVFWVFASILLIIVAIVCFLFSGLCR